MLRLFTATTSTSWKSGEAIGIKLQDLFSSQFNPTLDSHLV